MDAVLKLLPSWLISLPLNLGIGLSKVEKAILESTRSGGEMAQRKLQPC
jgi:hypothetical protein